MSRRFPRPRGVDGHEQDHVLSDTEVPVSELGKMLLAEWQRAHHVPTMEALDKIAHAIFRDLGCSPSECVLDIATLTVRLKADRISKENGGSPSPIVPSPV